MKCFRETWAFCTVFSQVWERTAGKGSTECLRSSSKQKSWICGPSCWFKNVFVFYHHWTLVSVPPGHSFLTLCFKYLPYTDAELWKGRWITTLAYLSLRDLRIYTRAEENMKVFCRKKIFWLVLAKAGYHFHQYGHLSYLQGKADQLTLRWGGTSESPEVPVLTGEGVCGVCPRQTNFHLQFFGVNRKSLVHRPSVTTSKENRQIQI